MQVLKAKAEVLLTSTTMYEEMLKNIEQAGRICYKSEDKITNDSAEKFIEMLIKRRHESVLEHNSISVLVQCDRGVTHEIVRHRIASYSQESTRYCNYSKDKFGKEINVIDIGTGFKYNYNNENDIDKYKEWLYAMEDAEKHYMKMIELGATPQEARSVLPTSLKTEIVITMNIREWRHFFQLRSSNAAHPQMREISDMILERFVILFPVFFKDLKP